MSYQIEEGAIWGDTEYPSFKTLDIDFFTLDEAIKYLETLQISNARICNKGTGLVVYYIYDGIGNKLYTDVELKKLLKEFDEEV